MNTVKMVMILSTCYVSSRFPPWFVFKRIQIEFMCWNPIDCSNSFKFFNRKFPWLLKIKQYI